MFEDDSRNGDEDDAAGQDKEDGGCDSNFSLADLPVFLLIPLGGEKKGITNNMIAIYNAA